MKCSLADDFEGKEDEDDGEDEAMAAIREMQRLEEEEQARIEAEEIVLQQQAIQIEKEAAQKEKAEKARMEQEERKAASTSSSSSSSFNQFSPKSSMGLKTSSGEGDGPEGNVNQGEQQQSSQQSFNEFAAKVNEKKQQQQRHPSSGINGSSNGRSSSGGGNISMGMGSNMDALSEIEARLRQAQQRGQGNADMDDSSQSTIDKEDHEMRLARYAVEYRFKRPVEKIIKAYQQKPIFDLYSILAVEETADATDIKFGYREMALLIHPDKNPHPNSKLAFDFLQEAYKILSSSEEREVYDKKLMKLRSTKLRLHKWKKKIENFYYNSKSKFQLLQYQGYTLYMFLCLLYDFTLVYNVNFCLKVWMH